VLGTLNLLDSMVEHGCRRIVFSSTCATYGEPATLPITEDQAQNPINPYGASKLMCERMLRDFADAHGVSAMALRYFNAAGADPAGRLGEDHEPETHLIPLVIGAAQGRRGEVSVFGDDYDTPDGTCIRDYIHVVDLADAHMRGLDAMADDHASAARFRAYNLGNEQGTSVLEVIRAVGDVVGRTVPHRIADRRPGDPPRLVGSSARIRAELGWRPKHGSIESIVRTACAWHERHPDGYAKGDAGRAT
jgi:UDP-glucose-4-epimerase GalE